MSQIELFDYSALAPDLQVEVKTATERIKLRMKRTAEDIIEIGKDLIAIKEKLPHGSFLPWIAAEFEMSEPTAQRFMQVAVRFPEIHQIDGFKPSLLYALSAPSTPDEVVEQVIEKAESGEKVTANDVKELREKLRQKEGEITQLKQSNQFVSAELQRQQELMTGIEATLQDSAKSLAEKMTEAEVKKATQELRNELIQLKADKQKLEAAQSLAESKLKDAQETHAKALSDFKSNPDPDTNKAIKEAQKALDDLLSERSTLATEVSAIQRRIKETIGVEEHRAHATGMVMSFFKKIEEVFENHHRHILSFSSLNLDDAYVAKAEDLIESLEDHLAKLKKALADRQFNAATQVEAVEVEVVEDDDEF